MVCPMAGGVEYNLAVGVWDTCDGHAGCTMDHPTTAAANGGSQHDANVSSSSSALLVVS